MIGSWGTLDRWDDYELLFGAATLDLRIVGQSYVLQRFRTRPLPIESKPLAMPAMTVSGLRMINADRRSFHNWSPQRLACCRGQELMAEGRDLC
jgi:hypothetical protein